MVPTLRKDLPYRFQLVAYFKNGTSPKNNTSVESEMSEAIGTGKLATSNYYDDHKTITVIYIIFLFYELIKLTNFTLFIYLFIRSFI